MSADAVSKRRFEDPEAENYSSLDTLAVVALICGLLSSLSAIFSPVFLILGFLAVILGVASLVRISRSEGILAGFWPAAVGMGVAIFFACFYLSYAKSRDDNITEFARKYADEWIEMIQQGRLFEAHQLTRSFFNREYPGTDLEVLYSEKATNEDPNAPPQMAEMSADIAGTPYQQLNDFFREPPMSILRKYGKDCTVKFVKTVGSSRDGKYIDYVIQQYSLEYEENGQPQEQQFLITMKRENYGGMYGAHWAVDMIDDERTMMDRTRLEK